MSENIPESIPTSSDRRSARPLKRRAVDPISKQAAQLETLFANPDKPIHVPSSLSSSSDALTRLRNAPPEIVANVQGSSAGAGSGEFHVYKASRRREYERLRAMDEEKEKEEGDAAFEAKMDEVRSRDLAKTEKNRAKREKARMRALKKKQGGDDGSEGGENDGADGAAAAAGVKKAKFKANTVGGQGGGEGMDGGVAVLPEEVGIIIHDED